MNKNFGNFKNALASLKYNFSIICFSETRQNNLDSYNQDFDLANYKSIHQIRNHSREIYIHKKLSFKIGHDLNTDCKDEESLFVEIISNTRQNTLKFFIDHKMALKIHLKKIFKDIFVMQKTPLKCIILQSFRSRKL